MSVVLIVRLNGDDEAALVAAKKIAEPFGAEVGMV